MKSDQQEYETKVLDVDPEEIRQKLRKLGAKETPERLMRRWVFDTNITKRKFVRLRDEGDKVTLTHKHRIGQQIGETYEIEVEVSDFDKTVEILKNFAAERTFYQENRRQKFNLENIEFCIDTWPKIPVYLEIESDSVAGVHKGLGLLGLGGKDAGNISVTKVYKDHGLDIHSFAELKFEQN